MIAPHPRRLRPLAIAVMIAAAAMLLGGGNSANAHAAPEIGAAVSSAESCDNGEFCTWPASHFRGVIHRVDLRTANPGECIPLPDGTDGRSFANRSSRDITVYQASDCATEADFTTYPGGGTYVPVAPFVVRAYQIWEG